jgi:Arc/MetJ family transcription regulator
MYVDGDFVRQMAARADEVRKMDVNTNKEAYNLAAKEIVEQVEKEFGQHRSWTNRRGGW